MTESLHQKPSEVNQNLRHSIDSQNIIETAESTVEERESFNKWYYNKIGESNQIVPKQPKQSRHLIRLPHEPMSPSCSETNGT